MCRRLTAGIKFLQEWATWLTVVNDTLFGAALGFPAGHRFTPPAWRRDWKFYAAWTVIITATVFITRVASLIRNARLINSVIQHLQRIADFLGQAFQVDAPTSSATPA